MRTTDADEVKLLGFRDLDQLGSEDRQEAARLAFHEGMDAAERLSSSNADDTRAPRLDVVQPEEMLGNPHRSLYYLCVIGPAARNGFVQQELEGWWRDRLSSQDSENDPRVAQFLAGWRQRAKQIVGWQKENGIRR